jgi:iron complex transport system ATP-binding protein
MSVQPYLDLQAVEAWRGSATVFNDLSLQLWPGEHTVVLGPNGSGKSSLIQLISRELYPVVKPGSWLRLFGSETVNLWDLRARIGLVSQDLQSHYAGRVLARDVVLSGFFGSVGLGRHHKPNSDQGQRVAVLMERFHLSDLAERPYGQLSDGQRRRLLLARALVHGPEILVLDEPTNGLDLRAKYQLLEYWRGLAQAGTTLLLVTHQLDTILPEISRCVLLKQGRIVGDGRADDLLRDDPLSALFDTPLQVLNAASGYRQVLPAAASDGER